jgi:hypothetical protein
VVTVGEPVVVPVYCAVGTERITTPSSALMMFLFSINEFNVPVSTE